MDFLSEVDPAPQTSEPFDEPSARMKCHWRAFFELSEPSAESPRQVAKRRKSPWNAEQKSGSPEYVKVNIKWSHKPSVQNPPSRRLNHLRHHQWNFMIPYSRMHNDRFSCRVTGKHNNELDWLSWRHLQLRPATPRTRKRP